MLAMAVPIAAPLRAERGNRAGAADEHDVEHDVQHRHRDAEPQRRPRIAGGAQRAAEHEEHQHADAEQEHRPQERQRLGAHRRRRVHEVEQRRRRARSRAARGCRATARRAVRNA